MRSIVAAGFAVLALTAIGCQKKPSAGEQMPSASEQPPSTPDQPSAAPSIPITDRDWVLIALGGKTAPLGSGNEPATMRLESANSTAAGFAGCNRYSSQVTVSGDNLRFGPIMSTKMACADGDELERGFLAALKDVSTYQATDTSLTLNGPGGELARFRPK
jgi:putative lipoprotein